MFVMGWLKVICDLDGYLVLVYFILILYFKNILKYLFVYYSYSFIFIYIYLFFDILLVFY